MNTLLDILQSRYPTAKRQTFKRMLQDRRIRINGKPARTLKDSLATTDEVVIADRSESTEPARLHLPFAIIFEDRDLLVIDKPPGLITSSGARDKRPTAWKAVQEYLAVDREAVPGLIHRLDRDASGLLVFSRNQAAYRSLKTQFFRHTVSRIYSAVVHGRVNPDRGRIDTFLIERSDGTVRSARTGERAGQRAVTDYETINGDKQSTHLRITLLTGRKHQIRVHFSERGHPIINDSVYGTDAVPGQLMLTAIELQLDHPTTGKRLTFTRQGFSLPARDPR